MRCNTSKYEATHLTKQLFTLQIKLKYHKVASSRPVYYSILELYGQKSQYISIKFPLPKAATHLVPNPFDPRTSGPPTFCPHGQRVPNPFGPPGQTVPIKFGPPGQMVPKNNWSPSTNSPGSFGPHGKMVPKTSDPP